MAVAKGCDGVEPDAVEVWVFLFFDETCREAGEGLVVRDRTVSLVLVLA